MKLTRKAERLLIKILFVFLLIVLLASFAWGVAELLKASPVSMLSLPIRPS